MFAQYALETNEMRSYLKFDSPKDHMMLQHPINKMSILKCQTMGSNHTVFVGITLQLTGYDKRLWDHLIINLSSKNYALHHSLLSKAKQNLKWYDKENQNNNQNWSERAKQQQLATI